MRWGRLSFADVADTPLLCDVTHRQDRDGTGENCSVTLPLPHRAIVARILAAQLLYSKSEGGSVSMKPRKGSLLMVSAAETQRRQTRRRPSKTSGWPCRSRSTSCGSGCNTSRGSGSTRPRRVRWRSSNTCWRSTSSRGCEKSIRPPSRTQRATASRSSTRKRTLPTARSSAASAAPGQVEGATPPRHSAEPPVQRVRERARHAAGAAVCRALPPHGDREC